MITIPMNNAIKVDLESELQGVCDRIFKSEFGGAKDYVTFTVYIMGYGYDDKVCIHEQNKQNLIDLFKKHGYYCHYNVTCMSTVNGIVITKLPTGRDI